MLTRNIQALPASIQRVISLVPSLTESLFDLGLGGHLVGVTDYCLYPAAAGSLPHLGGTKHPDLDAIQALHPDLIIANQEENSRTALEDLSARGLNIWLTFPQSVDDTLHTLRDLAAIFRNERAFQQVRLLERSVEWARAASQTMPRTSYFCPIWQDSTADGLAWWMTFNGQTYMSDLLSLLGGENVFAERQRRYPLEADLGRAEALPAPGRDTRYPRLTREEILAAAPEAILLPSEPYAYSAADLETLRQIFRQTPAVQNDRLYLIDGTLLTWHGTRLGKALQSLDIFFRR